MVVPWMASDYSAHILAEKTRGTLIHYLLELVHFGKPRPEAQSLPRWILSRTNASRPILRFSCLSETTVGQ